MTIDEHGSGQETAHTPSSTGTNSETWTGRNGLSPDGFEPIAVVGLSIKFPQEAESVNGFWEMLSGARNSMTEFPPDRINTEAFYHPDQKRHESFSVRGAHFLREDVKRFDAPFFGISFEEATAMDPQQRGMLETCYRALENAGVPLESISGTPASVYIGSFTDDYKQIATADLEAKARYTATGVAASMLANRVSWFFNLKGPSLQIDTACSSSLIAFHQACLSLIHSESNMALVGGCNLILNPAFFSFMSSLNFLSPDGKCWSFDHRANGYGRGEGFSVVILKRLYDAIKDGDTVRAVVRGSAVNQDGRTPGLTQPSGDAQSKLILNTYLTAKVDQTATRYFEAHGTGTTLGDRTEANAIGNLFRSIRSSTDPLYVGAVKSNIGHLEGASGLAGLIKAILVLERGSIPPNANFEKVNSGIDPQALNIKFPQRCIPWPTKGLRRASINCFGFGGANAHVILDDAYHYLQDRQLIGNHSTIPQPPSEADIESGKPLAQPPSQSTIEFNSNSGHSESMRKLLVWSTADETGILRLVKRYIRHFSSIEKYSDAKLYLDNLAFTLSERRSRLPWKSFAVVGSLEDIQELEDRISNPVRSLVQNSIAFVFTGQGAQWFAMGRELMHYSIYRECITAANDYLSALGCSWSVVEELQAPKETSRVNRPDFSQPLCTIVQVALIELLRSFGVVPSAVVGHSSGEIASAYAIGAISARCAWRLSFYRGILASSLSHRRTGPKGAMIATQLDNKTALKKIAELKEKPRVVIACNNSPSNVTISGDEDQIDELKDSLDSEKIFARKLQVDVAYHSPHMESIAEEYLSLCGSLRPGIESRSRPIMISSVTGKIISGSELREAKYWVQNMVSTVRFTDAMSQLCFKSSAKIKKIGKGQAQSISIDHFIEIGPHSALEHPVRDISRSATQDANINYSSVLVRGTSAWDSLLRMAGQIYCSGYPVDLREINAPQQNHGIWKPVCLTDLPEYPFNHSQDYWSEDRISKHYRLKQLPRHDFLGKQVRDWNPLQASWRNSITFIENPWIEDHKVNGTMLYPASGMIVMAVEAAKTLSSSSRIKSGYTVRNMCIDRALTTTMSLPGTDTNFYLSSERESTNTQSPAAEFRLCHHEDEKWHDICYGTVQIEYTSSNVGIEKGHETREFNRRLKDIYATGKLICKTKVSSDQIYKSLSESGYDYGPAFRLLESLYVDDENTAVAEIKTRQWAQRGREEFVSPHVVHPTTLDGVMQIGLSALSRGGHEAIPTLVPTRIKKIWLSSSGLGKESSQSVKVWAKAQWKGHREATIDVILLDNSFDTPLLLLEGLEATAVTKHQQDSNGETDGTKYLCYDMIWKADINTLLSGHHEGPKETVWKAIDPMPGIETLIDLLTHKNPKMDILELNTGDKTIFSLLSSTLLLRNGSEFQVPRYNSYEITKFSATDVARSDDSMESFKDSTIIRPIDVNRDLSSQGFSTARYNLLICSTNSLETFYSESRLKSLIQLIKPEGRILLIDSIVSDHDIVRSTRERSRSDEEGNADLITPMKLDVWSSHMDELGLIPEVPSRGISISGHKFVLRKVPHHSAKFELASTKILVIIHRNLISQVELADSIAKSLQSSIKATRISSLEQIKEVEDLESWTCLSLLEFDTIATFPASSSQFSTLQSFLNRVRILIWITTVKNNYYPAQEAFTGLSRVICSEDSRKKIIQIKLEDETVSAECLGIIPKILQSLLPSYTGLYETEYRFYNGLWEIPRVTPNLHLNKLVTARKQSHQVLWECFRGAGPLKLIIESPGLLETIKFKQDRSSEVEVAEDEVIVKVAATGVNFRDCLVALGRLPSLTIGVECTGTVIRVGNSCRKLQVGDQVGVLCNDTYKTHVRTKELCAVKLPRSVNLVKAAGLLVPGVTAYYALQVVARSRKGETVLIHGGAGGTGQAAIQLSKALGLEIFTTVSTEEKKSLLMTIYNIPEDHILYSRDLSFVHGIKRLTDGRGVDIVLNSLSGEQLKGTWECIAPFGRFLEIGNKDILSNSKLPMEQFARNVSYSGIDINYISTNAPGLMDELLSQVVKLITEKTIYPASPLRVLGPSQIEEAFRLLQGGNSIGKMIIDYESNDAVQIIKANTLDRESIFDTNATYIIAGGLGGLGRSITRWMVSRGARNFLLLSRSGPSSTAAKEFVSELIQRGINILAPQCDISKLPELKSVIDANLSTMPPAKGVIQSTMVLRDALFEKMSYTFWEEAILPKCQGTLNLHKLLPSGMDFFILLSSVSGIIGNSGQANYAAASTFLDGFASARIAEGEKAISLDLGIMQGEGYLANSESETLLKRMRTKGNFRELSQQDLFALLEHFCNPSLPLPTIRDRPQVITGMSLPTETHANGDDDPSWLRRPMFLPLYNIPTNSLANVTAPTSVTSNLALFSQTTSILEATDVVYNAVKRRLATALHVPETDVQKNKPMHDYGVDSLVAIEMRNWFIKEFKAEIPVWVISGEESIVNICEKVAGVSEIRKNNPWDE